MRREAGTGCGGLYVETNLKTLVNNLRFQILPLPRLRVLGEREVGFDTLVEVGERLLAIPDDDEQIGICQHNEAGGFERACGRCGGVCC
jgi:hypothetical protein